MKSAQRIVLAVLLLFFARPAAATISYHISLKNPEQHLFHISMEIPAGTAVDQEIIVALPAWNALYQVRDFSYRVRDVEARSAKSPSLTLPVQLLDKQTWKISLPGAGPRAATVDYSIEWDDAGPFNSQLNQHHAFVNFAEVLMYIPSRRAEETLVQFEDVPDGWRVAAELPSGTPANSFVAASYDKLADAPVEVGKFSEFGFDQSGAHFRVVVDGKEWHREKLESILQDITKYEIHLMGGAPFREYTFFFHFGPYPEVGGGGMEHSNCTAISDFFRRRGRFRRGARIFSRVERETHTPADAGAGGLHQRNVHTRAVVRRGSNQHLWLLHAGAHRPVDQGSILRRPGRAD